MNIAPFQRVLDTRAGRDPRKSSFFFACEFNWVSMNGDHRRDHREIMGATVSPLAPAKRPVALLQYG